jgi:hypothetical protein
VNAPSWKNEMLTPSATADWRCPHDGAALHVDRQISSKFRHCPNCRRVWNEKGDRMAGVWWSGTIGSSEPVRHDMLLSLLRNPVPDALTELAQEAILREEEADGYAEEENDLELEDDS